MSVEKMVFMPAVDLLVPRTQAVMCEKTAAKYVMFGIHEFRKLVDQGVISFRTRQVDNKRPFSLKHELDAYLASLPWYKIHFGESSSNSVERSSR